jgi:hypothetical protein
MATWLKSIIGAIAGLILGVAFAAAVAWWMFAGFDTSKAPSGQHDSYAMSMGFAIIGLVIVGAAAGSVFGIIVAWICCRRKDKPLQ